MASIIIGSLRQRCLRPISPLVQTLSVSGIYGWPNRPADVSRHELQARHSSLEAKKEDGNDNDDDLIALDPGRLVSGLTKEHVNANPEIAEFLRANFAGGDDGAMSSGITIPLEILQEFGITEDDVLAESSSSSKSAATKRTYGDPRIDAGLGNSEQQHLNIRILRTYIRKEEGSRTSQWLRDNDRMIPGLLYGSDPTQGILSLNPSSKTLLKTPWSELQRELDRYHRRFECRVYDLTILENEDDTSEGTVHRVVPRNVQRHPVKGQIYCSNFVRYHPGRPIRIPLTYINKEESPALKRDGYIVPVKKHVECFIEDGVPIPEALEVECTGLKLKDVVRMDRIIFPNGVRPIDRIKVESFVVGPVFGGKGGSGTAGDDDDDDDTGDNKK